MADPEEEEEEVTPECHGTDEDMHEWPEDVPDDGEPPSSTDDVVLTNDEYVEPSACDGTPFDEKVAFAVVTIVMKLDRVLVDSEEVGDALVYLTEVEK